ncbi:MAG: FAD-dependent oxidoreductase [Clostridiales bacterium]|nr:FAD-dependent oxidoreductase [Clostridiales bacterium]
MKKMISVVLSLAMATTLMACGSQSTTNSSTTADTTAAAETTAAADASAESASSGSYTPGTYIGEAEGFSGAIIATVTVDADQILSIEIDESVNTNQIIDDSKREQLAQSMIDAQTPLVDGIAGATISSSAIVEAVKSALTQAGATEFAEAERESYSRDDISFTPGTYQSVKMGMNGEIEVEVSFSEDKVDSITVLSSMETTGVGTKAMEILTDHILDNQSLGVDMVSGATYTSIGFMEAVKDCVEQADGNVSALESFPVDYDTYADATHEADVIIIGGGMAGMISALSCKQNGLSVILLEQKEFLGGNALAATGTYLLGNTSVQAAQGIEDDPEVFYQWVLDTIDNADPDLAHMLVDHSQELVDYFEENGLSFDYNYMKATTNSDIPRGHQILPTGSDSVGLVVDVLEQNDVDIRYLTTATTFILDDNGAVIGVNATDCEGNETAYYGTYVVLASGGFGDNQDILAEYWGEECRNLKFGGIKGSDGKMLSQAIELGADTVDMDAHHIDATLEVTHQIMADTNIITSCGGIIVRTSTGQRIADEAYNHGDAISEAEIETGDEYYYLIFDDSVLEFSDTLNAKGSMYINTGLATTYQSIEEMASDLELDEAVLQEVIDKYNAAVRGEGEDEFGRTDFYGELEAPYYVMKVSNGVVMTSGGLKVDDHSHVINTDGEIIEGLYAVGEVSGGLMRVYIAGASLSECGISGMLLGRQLSGAIE